MWHSDGLSQKVHHTSNNGGVMQVGDLVMWMNIPHIGVVMEDKQGYILVHWLGDGHVSWEDSRDLREVINESR